MTQTFATNDQNDIYIGPNGNLSIDSGQVAVEDACATASKMRLGEALFQIRRGLPMFQAIFNGVPQFAIYENALRNTLLSVDGVANVNVVQLTSTERNLFSYSALIESIYGKTFTLLGGL